MAIDWENFTEQDPWAYFNLPQEEEDRLRVLFSAKVGKRLAGFADSILLDMTHDDPFHYPEKFVPGIGSPRQIAGAMLFIIGDFIAQYHKLGRRYKLPLLPKEIMPFFRYPYHLFQDLNLQNQYKIIKQLNKRYKRGLAIYGT